MTVDRCHIAAVADGCLIRVWTAHSRYELRVEDPANLKVRIRGGRHFPEEGPAWLAGARACGNAIRLGGIEVGLPIELHVHGKVIVTSRVQCIEVTT